MDPSNLQKQNEPEEPRYLNFPHLPDDTTLDGKPRLNKYSSTLTKDHDFPGAQVATSQVFFFFRGHGSNLSERRCSMQLESQIEMP